MNRERIQSLLGLIPRDAPYLAQIPREGNARGMPEEVDHYAFATHDPQFGWGFVQCFARLGQPLPSAVYEPELLRAYSYVRHQNPDPDVLAALSLERSANYGQCILTRCLLLLQHDYSAIAQDTGVPEQACRIYELLFWNMRERHWIDRMALAFPAGRQVEFLPGYAVNESLMNLALRAAVRQGMPAVKELLGLGNAPAGAKVIGHAGEFSAQTLNEASSMMQLGFGHQNLAVFSRALQVLRFAKSGSAQHEQRSSRVGGERMGLAMALRESVMRVIGTDAPIGLPADPPEAQDLRAAGARAADTDTGVHPEPVDLHEGENEVPLLRAA